MYVYSLFKWILIPFIILILDDIVSDGFFLFVFRCSCVQEIRNDTLVGSVYSLYHKYSSIFKDYGISSIPYIVNNADNNGYVVVVQL